MQGKSRTWPAAMPGDRGGIAIVTKDRVTTICELRPNLIASTGLELHTHESRIRAPSQNLEVSDRFLALHLIAGRALIEKTICRQVGSNRARVCGESTGKNGYVDSRRLSTAKLLDQIVCSPTILGEHKNARGSTIKPMDGNGAGLRTIPSSHVAPESADHRALLAPLGRHGQDPGMLFDHEQRAIFVEQATNARFAKRQGFVRRAEKRSQLFGNNLSFAIWRQLATLSSQLILPVAMS